MATIRDLISVIKTLKVTGDIDQSVTDIQLDSRKVTPGTLFVAMRGMVVDGHMYIDKAIELGAVAVLCETIPQQIKPTVTYIQVFDCEDAVGPVATRFFDNPTDKVRLIGVTGTNGKTTIVTMLYNMFRALGYKCGLLSTVCNYIDGEVVATDHTTPDAVTLNRLLGRMADEGCKYVFMECSSHAIVQKRIGGLKYAGAIFTNLTRDHLDYHKTFESYLKAKKMFFDSLGKDAFMITNLDDRNGLVMAQNTRAGVKTYSLRSMSDFKGRLLESGFDGMLL